ncbi:NitT/TauT family transport system permease protein [Ancylobacter sp. 3268]|uniref:ABC transporter permease n=1 Tax=Ancylobacter sp. 3268 TaxID=2817752 RepID=UPI00285A8C62|nr:ABC transporter permease subunit [Ancylobacter sp. 3268]MDR6951159.1 NitT/TauT family transport system permease protein [Ancylobacter sp. 3268]
MTDAVFGHTPGDDTALSGLARARGFWSSRSFPGLSGAAGLWLVAAVVTGLWPDRQEHRLTADFAAAQALLAVLLFASALLGPRLGRFGTWLRRNAPWLGALPILLTIWQIASAKTAWWPQPYFPPPQDLADVYATDYARLWSSVRHSLLLLALGTGIGALVGFLTGVATGWSRGVGYWVHPVLRFIGPVPATALIPLVLFAFPGTFSAGIFLIALATWFPVTVLTWSGVAGVDASYYDVARTLGANQRFLLVKVAVPASLPHVFVGLFMGLGNGISVLVVAEMLGVKDGLGYYLSWAQGWGAYGHLYAGLLLMALLFSAITTLLFRTRDRLLAWQKGTVKW